MKIHEDEEFRKIPNFENYLVSNYARVYNTKYKRFLKPGHSHRGYRRVVLAKDRKSHMILLHRVVASAFLENPKNYPVVHHLDNNPSNNHISNLEWCSQADNVKYGYIDGVNMRSKVNRQKKTSD